MAEQRALGEWLEESLAGALLAQVQATEAKPVSKEAAYGSSVRSCSAQETGLSIFSMKEAGLGQTTPDYTQPPEFWPIAWLRNTKV